jgi:hypothetical protein
MYKCRAVILLIVDELFNGLKSDYAAAIRVKTNYAGA